MIVREYTVGEMVRPHNHTNVRSVMQIIKLIGELLFIFSVCLCAWAGLVVYFSLTA